MTGALVPTIQRRPSRCFYLGLAMTIALSVAPIGFEQRAWAAPTTPYLDVFSSSSYTGSDGTVDWTVNPWTETGDDGSPSTGSIVVEAHAMNPTANTFALVVIPDNSGQSVARQADLQAAGATTLSYQFHNEITAGVVELQLSDNGGLGWTTLRTYSTADVYGTESIDISTFRSATTQIRFATTTSGAGALRLDDIRIEVEDALIVNSTSDSGDANRGDGLCETAITGQCTLRAAIQEANAWPGTDTIHFDIPTSDPGHVGGIWTFTPASGYAAMTEPVDVDATTQPGYSGNPVIQLDGIGAIGSTAGLLLHTSNSTIAGFIVHSFPDDGLEIAGVSGYGDNNTLVGNWVGLDAAGTARGNNDVGILITSDSTGNVVDSNVVVSSRNAGLLIRLASHNTVVVGNSIGVAPDGVTAMPNGGPGIRIHDLVSGTRIGGLSPSDRNVIAFNIGDGIHLEATTASGNSILGNSIYSNGGLGIDLGINGVNTNDPGDADSGANDLLNFPAITSAFAWGGTMTATFDLDVPPGNYRVEFFSSAAADPSGHGEGGSFLSGVTATAGSGLVAIMSGNPGDTITATATMDLGAGTFGATSEFSLAVVAASGNSAPVAVDDNASTGQGLARTIAVLSNDSDPNGDPLTIQSVTQGANGGVTTNGTTVTYTPNPGFAGPDTFTYTITDGSLSDTATASMNVVAAIVVPTNNPPVIQPFTVTVPETTTSGTVLGTVSASDPDGPVTFGLSGDPRLSINAGTGTVTLVGQVNRGEVLRATATVTDSSGSSASAPVTVTISAVNSPPVVTGQAFTIASAAQIGQLLGVIAAGDPDQNPITFSLSGTGLFQIDATGRLTVASGLGAHAGMTIGFTVTVTDSGGLRSTASINVTILAGPQVAPVPPINRPPRAIDDQVSGLEDQKVAFAPLANDFDLDGDPLTLIWLTLPSNGTIDTAGGLWFVPDPDWNGTDSATYRISDGRGGSATATVTFSVAPVNDAPRIEAGSDSTTVSSGDWIEIPIPEIVDMEGDSFTIRITQPGHGTATIEDGSIVYVPEDGFQGKDTIRLYVTDEHGAVGAGLIVIEVVIDGETVSVRILDIGSSVDQGGSGGSGSIGDEERVFFGISFFGLIGSEILAATWAVRTPLILFVLVSLVTLLLTLRRPFLMAIRPVALPSERKTTWAVVLVGPHDRLPALSGPDHHYGAIHTLEPGTTGISGTGNSVMMNGTLWIEIATPNGDAWVEARYLTSASNTDDRRNEMRVMAQSVAEDISQDRPIAPLISDRGFYLVLGDEMQVVPQGQIDAVINQIMDRGSGESMELIEAFGRLEPRGPRPEIPIEFRNFHAQVVSDETRHWAILFDEGPEAALRPVGVCRVEAAALL